MKSKIFYSILLVCTLINSTNLNALKRKFKEETEKEKGKETTQEEVKKPKIEYEVVIDPSKKQPQRLMQQTAQRFIDVFLQAKNNQELEKLRTAYENLNSELKEYIKLVVNQQNSIGDTLLHEAKAPRDVEKLLFLGADPNIYSKLEQNPFSSMVARGNIEAAEALIDYQHKEPTLNTDKTGFTTLHYALMANAVELVQRILDNPSNQGTLLDIINELIGKDPGVSLLILAIQYSPQSIEPLINNGAVVTLPDTNITTPILHAAAYQTEEVLNLLVRHGADLGDTDSDDHDALFYANRNHNINAIHYLIKNRENKDVNLADGQETIFENAVSYIDDPAYHEMILEYLRLGGNPNTEMTNLTIIIPKAYNFTDLLNAFIDHGAEVNYFQDSQYPLASAIFTINEDNQEYGSIREQLNYNLIAYLIRKGAKITREHKNIIMKSKNKELIDLINDTKVFSVFESTARGVKKVY